MCFFCTGCGACERANFETQAAQTESEIHCLACGLAFTLDSGVCPSCGRPAPALPGTSMRTKNEN